MATELVTIGITSYCAENTIERAIASALSQTWPMLEIVVVDDASQDRTIELIKRLQNGHSNIRLFQQSVNQGVASARNRILLEASGEFIAFFDDDDFSRPNRIALQVDRIRRYERDFAEGALVVCHAARLLCFLDGSTQVAKTMGQDCSSRAPQGLAVAKRTLMGVPSPGTDGGCPTCSQMARATVYQAVGGFDPVFRRSEDTDFVVRLAMAGGHFVGIGEPLVEQHMTPTSDKTLLIERQVMELLLRKHRSFLDQYGEYEFTRRWNDMKYAWFERRFFQSLLEALRLSASHPFKTLRRLSNAAPQFGLNRAYRRFHSAVGRSV